MWDATYNQADVYYNDGILYNGTGGRRPDRVQIIQRAMAEVTTVNGIALTVRGSADILLNPTVAKSQVSASKDGSAFVEISTAPMIDASGLVSIVLTAAEMTADRIVVLFQDDSVPKQWEDEHVIIDTSSVEIYDVNDRVEDIYGFLTGNPREYKFTSLSEPVTGATITLTYDRAGTQQAATPQVTDSSGITEWELNPGVYYVWRTKDGETYQNPDTWIIPEVSPPSDMRQ